MAGTDNHDKVVLVAEDDEDDCLFIKMALEDNGFCGDLRFVYDGRELLDYLNRCGQQERSETVPCPDLILLDLNMPRMDGREALYEIKANPRLKDFPIVVLTTSTEERDIELCRSLGTNAYLTKPMTYSEWMETMGSIFNTSPAFFMDKGKS